MRRASLTLGPLLYNWPPAAWSDFYARIADEAPIATVCLGEVVCSKRWPLVAERVARVIERLMCDLGFRTGELIARYGPAADPILVEAARLAEGELRGLVGLDAKHFAVNESGRPLLRSICAAFDSYYVPAPQRHSAAV